MCMADDLFSLIRWQHNNFFCETTSWPPFWKYHIKSTMSVDAHLHEEHSRQISSGSDLKQWCLMVFWRGHHNKKNKMRSVPDIKITTRSSTIAVIVDRTACSILTLYSLWSQHLDLWIKKIHSLTVRRYNNYCGSASAVRTPLQHWVTIDLCVVYSTRWACHDKQAVRIQLVCPSPLDTCGVSHFFVAKRYILQQKCLNGQMGTCHNMLVQLLAAYTNPESHNAQRHRQTDGQQDDANSRSYCVAVRSAKNRLQYDPCARVSAKCSENRWRGSHQNNALCS